MPSASPPPSRAPRSDALANRQKLLASAAEIVKARGPNVPMAEIAEHAGVGVATLYRNFPNRELLLSALICRSLEGVLARARSIAADDGPALAAIGRFFDETIAHRDELILPLHGAPLLADKRIAALRRQIRETLSAVLARGRADGSIRADATAFDIILTGASLAEPLANVPQWTRHARRQARIYLAGLRAGDDPAPSPARRRGTRDRAR